MIVRIIIKYNGKYIAKAGMPSEETEVSDNIGEAYQSIMKYLKLQYAMEPPFLLMVRDMHVMGAIKKEIKLKEGDIFNVMPFLSGG